MAKSFDNLTKRTTSDDTQDYAALLHNRHLRKLQESRERAENREAFFSLLRRLAKNTQPKTPIKYFPAQERILNQQPTSGSQIRMVATPSNLIREAQQVMQNAAAATREDRAAEMMRRNEKQ